MLVVSLGYVLQKLCYSLCQTLLGLLNGITTDVECVVENRTVKLEGPAEGTGLQTLLLLPAFDNALEDHRNPKPVSFAMRFLTDYN